MTERIILIIISILMSFLTLRKKDKKISILTIGLTVGIILTFFKNEIIQTTGFVIYILFSLIIGIYGFTTQKVTKLERIVIILCGFLSFYANVSAILHFPYAVELRLSMIIPMVLYFVLMTKGVYKKKEFGILTILNFDFLFRILRLWY